MVLVPVVLQLGVCVAADPRNAPGSFLPTRLAAHTILRHHGGSHALLRGENRQYVVFVGIRSTRGLATK
ncbi:hypothetical protein E2C01_061959 [Portunus trituberculatus]|uniref:Secreted protein n=1 Tax=Portunus trituberculatus TaxID=210409 RepID=A0A5B7HDT5_PORTR|nr:hypothetical protein [Portunus trituberculatus]